MNKGEAGAEAEEAAGRDHAELQARQNSGFSQEVTEGSSWKF